MNNDQPRQKEVWASGDAYEPYVGRWSRKIASSFLSWLAVPAGSIWLDVGCGTGALSQTILQQAIPAKVKGIDLSESYIAFAKEHVRDERIQFEVGNALALSIESGAYDATVSGLTLNFVPQPEQAVKEMTRATKSGGTVAAYVWDYADKMEMMRYFWDAAIALDDTMRGLDESLRFPICHPAALAEAFQSASLTNIEARAIDVDTHFKDFDDYWSPFLGGQGAAPSYNMSLSEDRRATLRDHIRKALPVAADGSISLLARAWAVRGTR